MMAGPLVGGDRGIGWVRAIVGAFVVCLVVQYLVGKLLPEVLASVIAWGAFALVMIAVWRIKGLATALDDQYRQGADLRHPHCSVEERRKAAGRNARRWNKWRCQRPLCVRHIR